MNAYDRAVDRALAATGNTHLNAREISALIDRAEEATPHVQQLQRLHPGYDTIRDLLDAAGTTCARIGLREDIDPEFLDALLQEIAHA